MVGLAHINRKSQTAIEFLIAGSVAAILVVLAVGAFIALRQAYLIGTTKGILQQEADTIMEKIIEGPPLNMLANQKGLIPAGMQLGLGQALHFDWGNYSTGDALFASGIASSSNPVCESSFFVDSTGTHIYYQYATTYCYAPATGTSSSNCSGCSNSQPDLIYTAPAGATITLFGFSPPHVVNGVPEQDAILGLYTNDVEVVVNISKNVFGTTVTGSDSAMVNLGNHQ